jgi:hypothetical protein
MLAHRRPGVRVSATPGITVSFTADGTKLQIVATTASNGGRFAVATDGSTVGTVITWPRLAAGRVRVTGRAGALNQAVQGKNVRADRHRFGQWVSRGGMAEVSGPSTHPQGVQARPPEGAGHVLTGR